jgi:hypothetical protein
MLVLALLPWFISCTDKICRGFFWSGHDAAKGGSCLVNWNLVCSAKEYGGLGIKNLRLLKNAPLVKCRWSEKTAVDKPWEGMQIEVPQEACAFFDAAVEVSLGNVRRSKFWTDRWLNGVTVEKIMPTLMVHIKPAAGHNLVADVLPEAKWMKAIRGTYPLCAGYRGHLQPLVRSAAGRDSANT